MPKGCLLCVIFANVPLQTFIAKTVYFKWKYSYFLHGDEQPASVPVYNKFLKIIVLIWLWETLIYSHAVCLRITYEDLEHNQKYLKHFRKNLPVQSTVFELPPT
jgi:hypothetical protein